MAETPEIPEAKDPFERKVALSVSIIAVMLALISWLGDHAKTEAIINTSHASDKWAYYQSKSVKQNLTKMASDMIALTAANAPDSAKKLESLKSEMERYDGEKEEIKKNAEHLEEEATHELTTYQKYHFAEVLLQLGVVLSSVAILTRLHAPWFAALALAVAGAVMGALAYCGI